MTIRRPVETHQITHKNTPLTEISLNMLCQFIVDDEGRFVGILSMKDLENGIEKNCLTAEHACNKDARVISEPISNKECLQITSIFKSNPSLYYIPVISANKKPVGFFIKVPVILNCIVDIGSSIWEIIHKSKQANGNLYVVDGKKLVGVIGNKELNDAFHCADMGSLTAVDICNERYEYTTIDALADDVEMLSKHSTWPLMDNENNLIAVIHSAALKNLRSWNDAQYFELNWWKQYLQNERNSASPPDGYYNYRGLLLNSPPAVRDVLLNCWQGRTCLEIGAGPRCGYLGKMTEARRRIVIEPLADKYSLLREDLSITIPGIDDIEFYSRPADYFIPSLKDTVDGLIISQNSLDHTPNWCFILSNISLYAKKGACFYLWTDILHTTADPTGHYNITPDANQFLRLITSFGFEILYAELGNKDFIRHNLCITVFAVKR